MNQALALDEGFDSYPVLLITLGARNDVLTHTIASSPYNSIDLGAVHPVPLMAERVPRFRAAQELELVIQEQRPLLTRPVGLLGLVKTGLVQPMTSLAGSSWPVMTKTTSRLMMRGCSAREDYFLRLLDPIAYHLRWLSGSPLARVLLHF